MQLHRSSSSSWVEYRWVNTQELVVLHYSTRTILMWVLFHIAATNLPILSLLSVLFLHLFCSCRSKHAFWHVPNWLLLFVIELGAYKHRLFLRGKGPSGASPWQLIKYACVLCNIHQAVIMLMHWKRAKGTNVRVRRSIVLSWQSVNQLCIHFGRPTLAGAFNLISRGYLVACHIVIL